MGNLKYECKIIKPKKNTLKKRVFDIITTLKEMYPNAACSLEYNKAYELLISTRLSAQCTDARVNKITPVLFTRFPTLESLANADVAEIGKIIYSCGFYNTKSADIKAIASDLINKFGSEVPNTMEELLTLPGVGRKTANLIMGDVYHKPAIVADTHCIRIANRLGFCDTIDPTKVEVALKKIIPPEEQSDLCHRFVLFGRDVCRSQNPYCEECNIRKQVENSKN